MRGTFVYIFYIAICVYFCEAAPNDRLSKRAMAPPQQEKSYNGETAIVFFDLETSGLEEDCEVLEIAMKSGDATFKEYVTPTRPIPEEASAVNKLTNVDGKLYFKGELQASQPAETVLRNALSFLQSLGKPCTLVAHNVDFDAPRLIRLIKVYNLESEFRAVVRDFVDTVQLFRQKFPERNKPGQLRLVSLVADFLDMPTDRAHAADYDVLMLEKVTRQHFSYEEILKDSRSFDSYAKSLIIRS